jgi:hypothetical protein
MVKVTHLDALDYDSESDTEDGFKVFDGARRCFSGGVGTSQLNRSAPLPFFHSGNGKFESRRHFGMDGEWGRIFFKHVVLHGSL